MECFPTSAGLRIAATNLENMAQLDVNKTRNVDFLFYVTASIVRLIQAIVSGKWHQNGRVEVKLQAFCLRASNIQ